MDEKRMYEVALSGNVSEFESLMEKDPLILDRVLVTYSVETPLHIAALRGHLDVTKELLKRCPNLATELDSFRRSPLHLASARGHANIVRELLQVNAHVCSIRDEDGKTPLHLAAVKGRVEVIRELVRCRPESTRETLGSSGETVLHLCVKHNRLEALKLLMEESALNEEEFVNHGDNRGNTILHLSVALKQVKTIEYLVQIEAVKGQANMKNRDGFTALDILEHNPIVDSKSIEVRELLLQAAAAGGGGGVVNNSIRPVGINDQRPSEALIEETTPAVASELESQTECCSCKSVKERASRIWDKYFKIDDKWLEVARGNLITTAALTATVAFQAGLNPPGSVWQSRDDFVNSITATEGDESKYEYGSGSSIVATLSPDAFSEFVSYNTISFISSVCVILMMISGLPLNNKFSILLLTLAMCTTLTFMVLTYLASLDLLTPDKTFGVVVMMYRDSFVTGIALFALIVLINFTRLSVWTLRNGPQSFLCLVNSFIRCWKTVAARAVLVLHEPAARTDEKEPHHHQTA